MKSFLSSLAAKQCVRNIISTLQRKEGSKVVVRKNRYSAQSNIVQRKEGSKVVRKNRAYSARSNILGYLVLGVVTNFVYIINLQHRFTR
jgi:hypothetical protein